MYPVVTDLNEMIWYKADQSVFKVPLFRKGVSVYEATENDQTLIQHCIDLFNSEIQWAGMFDLETAVERFSNGNRMFILLDGTKVLGHVWFDKGYLYNLFVSQNRAKGDSEDFCHYTCNLIEQEISLYSVKDNIRAQKFFEKVGFTKI